MSPHRAVSPMCQSWCNPAGRYRGLWDDCALLLLSQPRGGLGVCLARKLSAVRAVRRCLWAIPRQPGETPPPPDIARHFPHPCSPKRPLHSDPLDSSERWGQPQEWLTTYGTSPPEILSSVERRSSIRCQGHHLSESPPQEEHLMSGVCVCERRDPQVPAYHMNCRTAPPILLISICMPYIPGLQGHQTK